MSSKESYSKFEITDELIQKILKVFEVVEKDNQAYDFLEPVDYVALQILDYPTIIKHPMDLGTVKMNMKDHKYPTMHEFLSDIDLIWSNCRTYNLPNSDICKMATHCEKLFKKNLDKQLKNYNPKAINKTDNNETNLKMEEKMSLTDKIRILSNEGLTEVVKLVKKECAKAFEDISADKVQIKIDLIDRKTYEMLLDIIDQCLKKSNKISENDGSK